MLKRVSMVRAQSKRQKALWWLTKVLLITALAWGRRRAGCASPMRFPCVQLIRSGSKLVTNYSFWLFFLLLYQQAFRRPDKTGQEGAAPEAVPTKGGRIGNGQLIIFFPFSVLFSVRERLSCCNSECFSKWNPKMVHCQQQTGWLAGY